MRILIADDESIIRLGLRAMLQRLGHEVVMAPNGREALQRAREIQFDLAILDIKMPLTDGLQAARVLSQRQPLPIILLTAFSEQDLVERATDLPVHGYLVKPVQEEALAAAIAVAHKRFSESLQLQAQAEKLAGQLAARKLIERAKGQLMAQGLSEEAAYQTLQQEARSRRLSLQQVALGVLGRVDDGSGSGS